LIQCEIDAWKSEITNTLLSLAEFECQILRQKLRAFGPTSIDAPGKLPVLPAAAFSGAMTSDLVSGR